jgi:hypothetical protein
VKYQEEARMSGFVFLSRDKNADQIKTLK